MTVGGPTIEILTDVFGIERSYCTMLSVFQVVHATMDMFLGLGTFRSSWNREVLSRSTSDSLRATPRAVLVRSNQFLLPFACSETFSRGTAMSIYGHVSVCPAPHKPSVNVPN